MVTLVCGLPNAGKTCYVGHGGLHLDDFQFGYVECNEAVASSKKDICVEGLYGTIKRRMQLLSMVRGEKTVCVWLDTPVEVCIERERNGRKRGDSFVLHHAKMFEPPSLDEGWDEIIIIRGEHEQHCYR